MRARKTFVKRSILTKESGKIESFALHQLLTRNSNTQHRYDRVRAVQKTGISTREMWHKTDWEKVKKDPTTIALPREDWILEFDAEKHAEETYERVATPSL